MCYTTFASHSNVAVVVGDGLLVAGDDEATELLNGAEKVYRRIPNSFQEFCRRAKSTTESSQSIITCGVHFTTTLYRVFPPTGFMCYVFNFISFLFNK